MKIQHYCYTRGVEIDYCNFSYPDNLSNADLERVRMKVLSIVGDGVEKDLSIPKWILVKTQDYIVWGVCCANEIVATNKYLDHKSRPIRGFFSVVISDYDYKMISLPYDLNYFRKLYLSEVEAYWNQWEQHQNKTDGFLPGNFNYVGASRNDYVSLLNTDEFQCNSLGELDKEGVIAAALTLDEVSLLIDNDTIEQATDKHGAFMNCLSASVKSGTYTVRHQCPRCNEYVSAFSPSGICLECDAKEKDRIVQNKREEEEMDQQLKTELDDARAKVQHLQYEIEKNRQQIKKRGMYIKILIAISVLLLAAVVYQYRGYLDQNCKKTDMVEKPSQEVPADQVDTLTAVAL